MNKINMTDNLTNNDKRIMKEVVDTLTEENKAAQIVFIRRSENGRKLLYILKNCPEGLQNILNDTNITQIIRSNFILDLMFFEQEVMMAKSAFEMFDEQLSEQVYLTLASNAKVNQVDYDEEAFQNIIVPLIEKISESNDKTFEENCEFFHSIIKNVLLEAQLIHE